MIGYILFWVVGLVILLLFNIKKIGIGEENQGLFTIFMMVLYLFLFFILNLVFGLLYLISNFKGV
jgi:hypothetical protein